MKRKDHISAYDWEASEQAARLMYERDEIDYDTYQEILGEIASDQQDYELHGTVEANATEHY